MQHLFDGELFQEIPDCPTYFASKHGKILSIKKDRKPRLIAQFVTPQGYLRCDLAKFGMKFVHRLVAATYLGRSHLFVNHRNGVKTDNRVENLEWVTATENMRHRFAVLGARSNARKLEVSDVRDVKKRIRAGETQTSIARGFGVSLAAINKIATGKNWPDVA